MMLCPQAWPTPGRASYSAQIATTSGPEPHSALKAVGMSATPRGHGEPAGGQCLGRPGTGPVLLERRLGVGVDGVAEPDQVVQVGVDHLAGRVLQRRDVCHGLTVPSH